MATVFISYSRSDTEFVKQLVAYLKQREIDYWLDLERIQAGADWADSVWNGLQSCDVMILVISPAAMNSREVAKEWKYHQQMGKPIVPVLVAGTTNIHYQLISLQYVDFQRHEFAKACVMLENEIARVVRELGAAGLPDETMKERPAELPPQFTKTTDLLKPYEGSFDRTTAKIDADLVKQFEERLHHFNERMLLELVHVEDRNLRIEARIVPGREYVIGRKSDDTEPDIDLMVFGKGKQGVSRRHAALKLDGDSLFIKDLGSTNNTFVEGRKLRGNEQLAVKSGDRIQMGNLMLTIHFRDVSEGK